MQMRELPLSEELDFAYLLELMPPLQDKPEFAWLPELFSIVGYEKLITLCRYAGGETIRIPTLDELLNSVTSIQWFYKIHIQKSACLEDVPEDLLETVQKIEEVYLARNRDDANSQ